MWMVMWLVMWLVMCGYTDGVMVAVVMGYNGCCCHGVWG